MKKLIIPIIALLFGCSDSQSNEDKVTAIDKDGSIESKISITHLSDSFDVMRTENVFWVKNKQIRNTVLYDTIPSLGVTKETGEDEDGNDSSFTIKKAYQIFITVK